MVGEAGSKRPPGEGKELRPTNSFIENSKEAGILLGKEHNERGNRIKEYTGLHYFGQAPVHFCACCMLHGGFLHVHINPKP
jgi:hypothetical protein